MYGMNYEGTIFTITSSLGSLSTVEKRPPPRRELQVPKTDWSHYRLFLTPPTPSKKFILLLFQTV